jgi:ornithine carbamoyltransferase
MTKDLTSINDLSKDEILGLLDKARDLKQQLKTRPRVPLADGAMAALVFEKPSLRTRVTFETAMRQLGGSAVYLGPTDIGLGTRETVPDIARNLSRWINCIIARVFEQDKILSLAENATVPVINALSDDEHPCQILADLQTVLELRGTLEGARIAWVGDGNNVCNSLMLASGMLGINLRVATPRGFEPPKPYVEKAMEYASSANASIELGYEPAEAVKDAEFIYTDAWTSMGQEEEAEQRRRLFSRFQVNSDLVSKAGKDVKVMHCLPAHRGEEITDEVLDGPGSVVLNQAENRLHAQRALLAVLLAK